MNKVLFIGLDSLDKNLVNEFADYLPHLIAIKQRSPRINIESVFPPDSDTAWATIYTGLNPAEHGVVDFIDPLDKSMKIQHIEKDNTNIRYNTFWDIAGKRGKKVCIINPHLGYPVWEVNGVMVGRSSIEDKIDTFPKDLISKYPELNSLNPWKGFPGNHELLKKFAESYKMLVMNEIIIAKKFINELEWDLFFVYSSALDAIQHYFWNYYDKSDPTYIDDIEFKNIIRDFYILYDDLIGQLLSLIDQNTITIVASDHGHGMRPVTLYNINEYLRQKELLFTKSIKTNPGIFAIEKSKRFLLEVVGKFKLENYASIMLKIFPIGKKIYTTPLSIDWKRTCAYASDLSGIKSYSYCGIIINKKLLGDRNYERVRSQILEDISKIKDPETNEEIIKWVCRREDLYDGKYVNKYPDVLVNMKYGYGAGWAANCDLFGRSKTHNFVPGSHRGDTPVLFISNLNKTDSIIDIMGLGNIGEIVLRILD